METLCEMGFRAAFKGSLGIFSVKWRRKILNLSPKSQSHIHFFCIIFICKLVYAQNFNIYISQATVFVFLGEVLDHMYNSHIWAKVNLSMST